MSWAHSWKARSFACFDTSKKSIHASSQAKVDFVQELAIDLTEFRIILLTRLQGLLRLAPAGPPLAIPEFHDPPVVESTTLALHKLQGGSILWRNVQLDLFGEEHLPCLFH